MIVSLESVIKNSFFFKFGADAAAYTFVGIAWDQFRDEKLEKYYMHSIVSRALYLRYPAGQGPGERVTRKRSLMNTNRDMEQIQYTCRISNFALRIAATQLNLTPNFFSSWYFHSVYQISLCQIWSSASSNLLQAKYFIYITHYRFVSYLSNRPYMVLFDDSYPVP